MAGDGERFVGFDFAGMAAQWLGLPNTTDPTALAMQYAAQTATERMPAAQRLTVARAMQEYFSAMERKAAADMGRGGGQI